ncbi:hypothetical protein ACIQUZ_28455 [Streptomyces griseus]|uniref:Cytochrome C oxidase subunit I n=1 Tax=Streptomyces griseus subsp. griseus (strain JCM 4626 / CBS 651.72 / NBRC 13350 / KCC S-0626 / ISP 5235) TaxID=455632 RepID=B1VQ43_STRGG|nr:MULTISPECIES: hypothetical protein [Streptomyces]MYR15298.1 hypothetical protein [Streptomyces sp. SID724]MYR47895.1 hypothetical protein [Streptomyces sp. SID4928]MYT82235.1 hypothetical protein [Streptomyces sp. SID8364]EGE39811.1 hypothetical protein SACT1_0416 [Streptomyces sp. ACT-1]MBW3702771.1 hypothetical protein [Streptomyces griseus]
MKPEKDCARGLAQLEGFLLWNAEIERARRQARLFTHQLPWLTTAQREDVERVFIAERVAASRESLIRVRDRADELREEYTGRYARLRVRCVAVSAGAVGAATCLGTVLMLALR